MQVSLKAIVIIGAVLLLTWTSATQARDVVIGYSGRTIAEMPFAWGSRKGFFKEANLDVKMIYMSTSIAAKGLMSGDVDYSTAMGGTLAGGDRRRAADRHLLDVQSADVPGRAAALTNRSPTSKAKPSASASSAAPTTSSRGRFSSITGSIRRSR